MSTLAFAALTNKRDEAAPGTSTTANPPGVSTFVDALVALVPAEVLTLHAVILTATTTTANNVTKIDDPAALKLAFGGLIVLSIIFYVVPRFQKWETLDFVRAAIGPLAFVGWTMIQKSTAFDAVAPNLSDARRTVIGLFLAVLLGVATAALARKADQRNM